MTEAIDGAAGWLPAARAGSLEALGQLLEACRGYLILIAQRELGAELQAKGGASDLVQETLLEALQGFDRFRGETGDDLRQWLRRLLLNNLIDFTRQYRATEKRELGREAILAHGTSSADAVPVQANLPSPSDVLMAREEAEAMWQAVGRLPEDYRRAIVWRFREGRSFDDIGAALGLTANAARKLVMRAVERVQLELGES